MNFYTSTSFRNSILKLTRKPKDGYESVVKDICETLNSMDDSFLRESKDRIRQEQNFRIVKLRVKNSHQNLPKNDAFRLIYWVSTKTDNLVFLRVCFNLLGNDILVDCEITTNTFLSPTNISLPYYYMKIHHCCPLKIVDG